VVNPKENSCFNEPSLPTLLTNLYCSDFKSLNSEDLNTKCTETFQNLKVSASEAQKLEKFTRQQRKCLKWFDYRKGRVTASNFYAVTKTKLDKPSKSLLEKIVHYTPIGGKGKAVQWGIDNEDKALKSYETMMKNHHSSFILSSSGLVVNPVYPHLGASPDGLSSCSCCGKGVVEVKCTFKYADCHPCEVDSDFYLSKHNGKDSNGVFCANSLDKNSCYYYQIQGQIVLCDVSYCDFVCWTTKGIHIERVSRDDTFFNVIKNKLDKYFVQIVLPELLTRKLLDSTPNAGLKKTYCICDRDESYDNMIACDAFGCKAEWYHFKCVGLKSVPRGSWLCSSCTKSGHKSKRKRT